MRRRAWVAASAAAVLAFVGAGTAYAYLSPGTSWQEQPAAYFTFCADRQLDVGGITQADLSGAHNGGMTYGIENIVQTYGEATVVGQGLSGDHPFVKGKSGIRFDGAGSSDVRRVLTTQWVERDAAGDPVQIRCKMRTHDSLNQPTSVKQKLDDNTTVTDVPWGFGDGSASGPAQSCRTVQQALVGEVWDGLTQAERDAATYAFGTSAVEFGPETYITTGSEWTQGEKIVTAENGVLTIADRSLVSEWNEAAAPSDRLRGAYYCTFVAPDYIRSIFLNGPVV